jgi:hypothetical protein
MKIIDVDIGYDPENAPGRPRHFMPDFYLDAVEQMIAADEIERALWMLDNMPAYYRDNVPVRALEIKRQVYQQLMSTVDYIRDMSEVKGNSEEIHGCPLHEQWATAHFHPRGPIAIQVVNELNAEGFAADIVEFGPANYWLPAALKYHNVNFNYRAFSINPFAQCPVEPRHIEGPKKQIFCAFEVIEHLWHEDDIFHYYAKFGIDADIVMLSTPKYTLYGGLKDWQSRELGHLRTYTPKELLQFAAKHWPTLQWTFFDADMMLIVGQKPDLAINLG